MKTTFKIFIIAGIAALTIYLIDTGLWGYVLMGWFGALVGMTAIGIIQMGSKSDYELNQIMGLRDRIDEQVAIISEQQKIIEAQEDELKQKEELLENNQAVIETLQRINEAQDLEHEEYKLSHIQAMRERAVQS